MPDEAPPPTPTPPPIQMPTPSQPRNAAPQEYDGTERGWAPGAWERFRELSQRHREMSQQLEAGAFVPREDVERRIGETRAELTARHQQELALERAAADAPNLRHASVRGLFSRGFDDHATSERAAGRDVPTFDAWLQSDAVKADPIYSVHLSAPAPAPAPAPAAAPPPRQAPPDPNAGAEPPPPPGRGEYQDAEIARIAADPRAWQEHSAAIRAKLEASLGKSLGGKAPPKV